MIFFGNFFQGIKIGIACIRYAFNHRSLLLLTALPITLTVITLLTLLNYMMVVTGNHHTAVHSILPHTSLGFIITCIVVIIANTLFTAALQNYTKQLLDNQQPSLRESLKVAFSHFFSLAAWAFLSFKVRSLTNKSSQQGNIANVVGSTVQAAWNISTLFVIPSIIFDNYTIFGAIGNSYTVVKNNISKNMGIYFAIAAVHQAFIVITVLLLIASAYLLYFMAGSASYTATLSEYTTIMLTATLVGIPMIIIYTIKRAALTIFAVVLYNYAYNKNTGPFKSLLNQLD